jgi:hypothetical protein
LILTHLNPYYFNNFLFKDLKVYYLDKTTEQGNIQSIQHLETMLIKREHKKIENELVNEISKYLLHFHPGPISKRKEFRTQGFPELWGEENHFTEQMNEQAKKYLSGEKYDPIAVCCALRVKIEEIVFKKLANDEQKNMFLATHVTHEKLEQVETYGVSFPESYFLLGIIYNDALHCKENKDNVTPIASKLSNLTIKKLIKDIFDTQ